MSDYQSFIEITGTDEQTAKGYIEMAEGDFARALDLYYSNASNPQAGPSKPRPKPTPKDTSPGPVKPPSNPPSKPSSNPPSKPSSNPASKPSPKPSGKPGSSQPSGNVVDDIFNKIQNQEEEKEPNKNIESHKIIFWKSGFQVDGGEYRTYDDPANASFLDSCAKGQIPKELFKPGVDVNVDVENNREKEFKNAPNKPKVDPYAGKAHSLSDSGPAARPSPKPSAATAQPVKPTKTNFNPSGAPSTKLRIQTPDNQAVTIVVPLASTISELRQFIIEARPDLRGKRLNLAATFPNKPLTEDSSTVEQEGIKQATINVTF